MSCKLNYLGTFCTPSGSTVFKFVKFENGVPSFIHFNTDDNSLYTGTVLDNVCSGSGSSCCNSVNSSTLLLDSIPCTNSGQGSFILVVALYLSDLAGLKNGSQINFGLQDLSSNVSAYNFVLDPTPNPAIVKNTATQFEVTDISLLPNVLYFRVELTLNDCTLFPKVVVGVSDISGLNANYYNGLHNNFFYTSNIYLKLSNRLSTTLQNVKDSAGNQSPLLLASNRVANSSYFENSWVSAPTGTANKTMFYFDTLGRMAWRNGTGFTRTFDASTITADRVYTLPDATTTLAGLSVANTWTAKQSFSGSTGTSLLNFPNAGTTAADGISFGTGIQLYKDGDGHLLCSGVFKVPTTGTIQVKSGADTRFAASGSGIILSPGTLSSSSAISALDITQTWNTIGSPTLIKVNITNTASGANANFMNFQISGVDYFTVNKGGGVSVRSHILPLPANTCDIGSTSARFKDLWIGTIDSRRIKTVASVVSDIPVIAKGMTGQTANLIEAQDVSANALMFVSPTGAIQSLYQRFGSGSPEGVVTAPIGATYSRTDGSAGTSFYVKESGTGNTGWVAK